MKLAYPIALGFIGLFSLLAYFGILEVTKENRSTAALINIVGRQRMLIQRVDMICDEITLRKDDEVLKWARQGLLDTADLLDKSRGWIVNGDAEQGLPGNPSPAVRAMLFQAPLNLNQRMQMFATAARNFSTEPGERLVRSNPYFILIEREASSQENLIRDWDSLVAQYQTESESYVSQLELMELGALGGTLALLLISGLLVFRPMCRRIEDETTQLMKSLGELKATQKLLVRNEKLASLGQLSAGVAHEIKNPLNIISIGTQLILMEPITPDVQRQCEVILEQVRRTAKIADNLREFARQRKPEMKEVDVNKLLKKTVALVEYEMNLDNVKFALDLGGLTEIFGDVDQLAQVFLNIINNAADSIREKQKVVGREKLKAIGWNGEIVIKTRAAAEWVTLEFRDSGTGISSEVIGRIFDPFFTTKDEHKGTGLGLSIAFGIMENHHGTITVESAEGEWTKFTLKFPTIRWCPIEHAWRINKRAWDERFELK